MLAAYVGDSTLTEQEAVIGESTRDACRSSGFDFSGLTTMDTTKRKPRAVDDTTGDDHRADHGQPQAPITPRRGDRSSRPCLPGESGYHGHGGSR